MHRVIASTATVLVALLPVGCNRASPDSNATPIGSASGASAAPSALTPPPLTKHTNAIPDEKRQAVTNPRKLPPYSGPVGTLRGAVTITGDEAPKMESTLAKIPRGKCLTAHAAYARLFSEGEGRTVADAMVAVTEYDGFVPAKSDVVTVVPKGCTWQNRTIVMTYGQRLEVQNKEGEAYVPQLLGATTHALVIAIPGGDSVKLFPEQPGRYVLIDNIHPFMVAEVFVLPYATADVTGVDGRYEITGIPVGTVTVNAYLPVIGRTVQKKVEIAADATVELPFELDYSQTRDTPDLSASAAPSARP